MKAKTPNEGFEKLIPDLSNQDKKELLLYFKVYESHSKEFSKRALKDLENHSVFGDIVKNMSAEESNANQKISLTLQKDAVLNNNWIPFIEYQINQGIMYAKMGLDFKSWYEVVALVKDYITPYLFKEYGNGEELFLALRGLNSFMDIAMGIIGEAYMREKNDIIKQNNERLHSIFETTADAIFDIEIEDNSKYKFVSVNKSFERITGASIDQIIGKYAHEIIPPESINHVIKKYRQAIDEKKIIHWEDTFNYPKGELTTLISISPIFNQDGNCIRLIGTLHDITERKKAEDKIKELNKNLEQKVKDRTSKLKTANEELEAFTYSVSHDLRAPLRAIHGFSQMLIEDYENKLDPDGIRIINTISNNATKLGDLIDDLLAFSQLGRKKINREHINMNELIDDVLDDINKSFKHNTEIIVDKLHNIDADYSLIKQVIRNLISNAIKYSSNKTNPRVNVSSKKERNEIIFTVADNGAGFDMQYADKLFGVFERLHSQEEFEGIGVGLAIAHRVIKKHNGRIWAEGEVNKGATFNFALRKS